MSEKQSEAAVQQVLRNLAIPYQRREHPPVFTVAQARHLVEVGAGKGARCLFLRNKAGRQHFLVILEEDRPLDLKRLARQLGESNLGLASPERLGHYLGVQPGAVSPFGLLNDPGREVTVVLDSAVEGAEQVGFHPNVNTVTLFISGAGLNRFLAWLGSPLFRLDFSGPEPAAGDNHG